MSPYDAATEAQAETRARALLRSCISEHDWAVYERFGFLAVKTSELPYAYLVYPHKPLVAYNTQTHELLGEYCVAFQPSEAGARLPPSDDVLAKWLALNAQERELIALANVSPSGQQLDPARVGRDLASLAAWTAAGAA